MISVNYYCSAYCVYKVCLPEWLANILIFLLYSLNNFLPVERAVRFTIFAVIIAVMDDKQCLVFPNKAM
jgi:hypothetical protein